MERQTFRILFLLRKARTGENGLAPILARISTSGLQSEIYIQYHANPTRWNQSKERATGNDRLSAQINASLDSFRAQVIEVRRGLIAEGLEGNAIQIKERIANPGNASMMFLAELDKYCVKRQAEVGTRVTQLTANKYHRILRYLREYTFEAYKKEDGNAKLRFRIIHFTNFKIRDQPINPVGDISLQEKRSPNSFCDLLATYLSELRIWWIKAH